VSIISQDGDKELASKLRAQLEGYKISVNPEPLHATYWLVINKSNVQQQIISVGSTTKPRQYQLIMRTEFTLQTPKGQIIKAPRTVFVSRQFTANNDRILGSDYEERVLISEMRHDVVIQILNRLSRE
jgi:LPS-assembly lipoprotein